MWVINEWWAQCTENIICFGGLINNCSYLCSGIFYGLHKYKNASSILCLCSIGYSTSEDSNQVSLIVEKNVKNIITAIRNSSVQHLSILMRCFEDDGLTLYVRKGINSSGDSNSGWKLGPKGTDSVPKLYQNFSIVKRRRSKNWG